MQNLLKSTKTEHTRYISFSNNHITRKINMKKRAFLLIVPIITIILETLPNGVVLYSRGTDPKKIFVEYFSYFDTIPYGYAVVSPLLTSILSCIILFLLVIYWFFNKSKLLTVIKILLYIATLLSLAHIVMGLKYFTITSGLITLSMIIELVLLNTSKKISTQ